MPHDYKAQEQETLDTFTTLKHQGETLPETSVIEFYLLAESEENNWSACEKALRTKGFVAERDFADGTLIVSTHAAVKITPENIWRHERIVTEIGLKYDFIPDGWEFGFDQ